MKKVVPPGPEVLCPKLPKVVHVSGTWGAAHHNKRSEGRHSYGNEGGVKPKLGKMFCHKQLNKKILNFHRILGHVSRPDLHRDV